MATPFTNTLWDTESTRIREIINRNINFLLPDVDPVFRDTIASSQGVMSGGEIGRDMLVKRVYMGSFAGVLEQSWPRNEFPLFGDATDTTLGSKIFTQSLAQTFPDSLDGPNPRPYRFAVPMRAMVANLLLTLGEMMLDATEANIGEIVVPKLEAFARNISHTVGTYFYLNQAQNYRLAAIATVVSGPGAAGVGYPVVVTLDNQAIDRFVPGQRLDYYESTGATRQNLIGGARSPVYVGAVDELTGEVTLVFAEDPTTFTGGIPAATDLLVYAESRGATSPNWTGLAGINSYLKASGNLLGSEAVSGEAIDVDVHPEHKSFLKAVNDVLTESRLLSYLKRFHYAKRRYGMYIDTLISTDGVWQAYWEQKIGREIIDRTRMTASINHEGLEEGFEIVCEGRRYMGFVSDQVDSGRLYGIRRGGNNWKRVMPSSRNVQRDGKTPEWAPFEFVAPALTGTGSIKLPVYRTASGSNPVNTLVSEGAQMPGWLRMQLVPDQFAGLVLTGLTETRVFSD